jgi:hypothetical protein
LRYSTRSIAEDGMLLKLNTVCGVPLALLVSA